MGQRTSEKRAMKQRDIETLRQLLEYVDIQGQHAGFYFGGAADLLKRGNNLLRRLGAKPVKLTAAEITDDLEFIGPDWAKGLSVQFAANGEAKK